MKAVVVMQYAPSVRVGIPGAVQQSEGLDGSQGDIPGE